MSEFNEKLAEIIIYPTEIIITDMIISQLYLAMKMENAKGATIEKISEKLFNEEENSEMFLSVEEETTVHLLNYVEFIYAITKQCIIELDERAENVVDSDSEEQKLRKTMALEKWRTLEKRMATEEQRLMDKMKEIVRQKFPHARVYSAHYRSMLEMESFVESGICEKINF